MAVIPKPSRTNVGRLLQEMRTAKKWSQQHLAEQTKGVVSLGYVGMIESGHRNPSTDVLDAVADALGLTKAERQQLHDARATDMAAIPERPKDLAFKSATKDISDLNDDEWAMINDVIDSMRRRRNARK